MLFSSFLGNVVLGAVDELEEDAAYGPHVNCLIVVLLSQNNFRSPVPPRLNASRHLSIFLIRDNKRSFLFELSLS